MTILAATLVLLSPFALAVALSWIARRNKTFRIQLDQFRVAAPLGGTFADDRDLQRQLHEMQAIHSRREPVI
ncbi:hypothetical protein [Mycobacterium sp. NPDC050853]|uniref:hypothetical protein n=1 Tax=Mycobacterium sp. NPDC050853 TaxID=3155160 RepID=UPI0033C70B6A